MGARWNGLNATQQVLCRAVKPLSIRAVRGGALPRHPLIEFMAHVPARHPAGGLRPCKSSVLKICQPRSGPRIEFGAGFG
jgi:hypothetical protein